MLLIWLCACELAPSETPVGSSVLEQPGPLELAEALYAIDQPSPQAQRVSMLLWLRSMELSPEQLSALRSASVRVRNALAQRDAELEVIAGAQDQMHPVRRKLSGRGEGAVYDQLLAVQAELARGEDGTGKPMTCSASMLAKVASLRNADLQAVTRLIGEKYSERFGQAFVDVLVENA